MGLFSGPTEQELAEARRRTQQWFAAAPCPSHGTISVQRGYTEQG